MEGFQAIMSNHSDDKLIEILNNRNQYQEVAVSAAIHEAIQRNLIEDEADLETKYPAIALPVYHHDTVYIDHQEEARRKKANSDMLYGALWCVGGLVLTFAHIGFIFWGAIVFGGIQFFRGLANSQ